jgi:hypothetical protein
MAKPALTIVPQEGPARTHTGTSVLSHIIVELAREPEHPHGDREHAYHLHLPLTEDGLIDAEAWRRCRQLCRVRRQRPGEAEAHGRILHGPGGHWIFDYDGDTSAVETGFRLDTEHFVPGEYISIREDDGKLHTFQVLTVRAA